AVQARGREVRMDDAVAARTGVVVGVRDLQLSVAHELVLSGSLDDIRQGQGRRATEKQQTNEPDHQQGGRGRRNQEAYQIPPPCRWRLGDRPSLAALKGAEAREHVGS